MLANKRGILTFVVFFLIVFGLVGLFMGYKWYNQHYYVALYDGNMVRYIDIPPFSERISSASDELRGECILSVGTSSEQINHFFKSMCDRYGYLFYSKDEGIVIEIRKNYIIKGTFGDNKLKLVWTPQLSDKLKKKADGLFKKTEEMKKSN